MEAAESTWIGVTCWQIMMVLKSTSKLKRQIIWPENIVFWIPVLLFYVFRSTRAVASEHLVGGDSWRRTVSASWTRNPHARETVLPVTQKVQKQSVVDVLTLRPAFSCLLCFVLARAPCVYVRCTLWLRFIFWLGCLRAQQLGAYSRLHVNQRIVSEPGTYTPSGGSIMVSVARPVVFPAKDSFGPREGKGYCFFPFVLPCLVCQCVFFFLWLFSVTVICQH